MPSPGRGRASRVRGHRHCMVVVHVARRGAKAGSSSDRVVAGDGLRPMYLHNKRQEKKTPKSCGCCAAKKSIAFCCPVHCVCCVRPVIALRRSPAFQSAAGVRRTPPAPTAGSLRVCALRTYARRLAALGHRSSAGERGGRASWCAAPRRQWRAGVALPGVGLFTTAAQACVYVVVQR